MLAHRQDCEPGIDRAMRATGGICGCRDLHPAGCWRATSSGGMLRDVTIRRAIPNVVSEDLDSSRAFYEGFLGFEVAMDEEGFVMFASPSTRTAQVTAAAQSGPGQDLGIRQVHMSVEVADVDATHALAERLGLEVIYPLTDEPWGIRRFFVRDPDGTVVNVNSHIAPPPER